jgi:hypothetical protein
MLLRRFRTTINTTTDSMPAPPFPILEEQQSFLASPLSPESLPPTFQLWPNEMSLPISSTDFTTSGVANMGEGFDPSSASDVAFCKASACGIDDAGELRSRPPGSTSPSIVVSSVAIMDVGLGPSVCDVSFCETSACEIDEGGFSPGLDICVWNRTCQWSGLWFDVRHFYGRSTVGGTCRD